MAKIAFVFPGQGSQQVGMGKAAFEAEPASRAVFEAADAALGRPLSRMCFDGPDDALQLTENAQPAILTTSIALLYGLNEQCDVVAGHSLGEYSAHVCAGTLAFADAVRLVCERGRLMQRAVPVGLGAMAAVLGTDAALVESVCLRTRGRVQLANYNSPSQQVIAGEREAVRDVMRMLETLGARARLLPVSAPFHCALMAPAEARLAIELAATEFREPTLPVYANVDADRVVSAKRARETLTLQVSRPVRWQRVVERMLAEDVVLFVEIGPGQVLSGLLRRIARSAMFCNVESPADFGAAREAIAAARRIAA